MDALEFWDLISGGHRPDETFDADRVVDELAETGEADIVMFDRHLQQYLCRANTYAMFGAANLAQDGCTRDGFEHFKAWLVAQGRAVFERVVDDPDALADLLPADSFKAELDEEELLYVAERAFERMTGGELPRDAELDEESEATELEGKDGPYDIDLRDEDLLAERYPRLAERFVA